VQLDRIPPRSLAREETGTPAPPAGVVPDACSIQPSLAPPVPAPRAGIRSWALVLLLGFAVLGQGSRCQVDVRFRSPLATLVTFWNALRDGDAETASLCLEDGEYQGPLPGTVWSLPPTRSLRLQSVNQLPVRRGLVMVNYEVHYLAEGVSEELSFPVENRLVQVRGEWRISAPLGEASVPVTRPIHRLLSI